MSFTLSSPVTGATMTGYLTSPTYTVVLDSIPGGGLTKQYAVTALGGTQTDVSVHTTSSPFAISLTRPQTFKGLGAVNPTTGSLNTVPRNTWKLIAVKGATPLTGQAPANAFIRSEVTIPAGVDVADPNELAALFSFYIGCLTQLGKEMVDSLRSGII